ncbi:MAG: prepilin-type N-terminal cleavage/methylation domain-containing protein [Deltaproteobacteria bacterium]|nr:prepilin-type N-terminal cleavage/methylation domain-containing protein [Candidatus Dadabacteria bacterium]TDJ05801.1 MAG: prepilin-type N-terminal cleavage/methylation domain-containing protein [Deltaproteobacteria bacterium]
MINKILKSRLQCQTTNKGFTLVEVLIALFIGSLILGVLYASFFQIIKSKEIAENELEVYHEARVIFSRITKDLNSIYPRGNVFLGKANYISDEPYFEGGLENDNSWIKFTSLSRAPSYNKSDSDQAQITYYIEEGEEDDDEDGDTKLFSLMRRENPYIGGNKDGISYSLSDRIVFFRLDYLSGDIIDSEDSYIEEWNSNESQGVPRAIDIRLMLRSPGDEDVEFRNLVYLQLSK